MKNLLLRLFPTEFRKCKVCNKIKGMGEFHISRHDKMNKSGNYYRRHECKDDEQKRKVEERIRRVNGGK